MNENPDRELQEISGVDFQQEKEAEVREAVELKTEFAIEDIWTTGCALNTTGVST
uniref:Uncharacterized protein n=1 Tax=Candidatus Kentrum sp. UNK TaxID=2126344 RepID=A0A451AYQ8_9GAMM|nr:MAG: hypothetical protein BECKUNK1418G_GA0071005_10494 [Candidatus Kentron sp. UNK]VFK71160.1 MAG: hypothetical protein BECKUNK1418H_GA0071006_10534 [Candidatus Kentron sp. UNK]